MERLGLEKLVEESIAQCTVPCSEGTPGRSQLWMGLLGCTEVRGDSQGEADVTHSASLEDYSLLSTCSIWELGVRYWWVIAKAVCPQVSRRIWVSNSALVFHKHTRTRLLIRSGFGSDTLLLHLPSPETCLVPRGPWLWPLDLGGDDRLKRGLPKWKVICVCSRKELVTKLAQASQKQIGMPVTEGIFQKIDKKEKI